MPGGWRKKPRQGCMSHLYQPSVSLCCHCRPYLFPLLKLQNIFLLHIQDARIFVSEVEPGKSATLEIAAGRQAYLLCVEGACSVDGADGLERHDAAELTVNCMPNAFCCFTVFVVSFLLLPRCIVFGDRVHSPWQCLRRLEPPRPTFLSSKWPTKLVRVDLTCNVSWATDKCITRCLYSVFLSNAFAVSTPWKAACPWAHGNRKQNQQQWAIKGK